MANSKRLLDRDLREAARANDLDKLDELLSQGADINALSPTEPQDSPLHCAVRAGHLEAVQLLVRRGADLEVLGGMRCIATPFLLACHQGQLQIARFLSQCGADHNRSDNGTHATGLHAAAQNGHLAIARFLVDELGVDPDRRETDQTTALSRAAEAGAVEMVVFLSRRADCNAKDAKGLCALAYACHKERAEVVRHLLSLGPRCTPFTRDNTMVTCLHRAVRSGSHEIARMLVEKGLRNCKAASGTGVVRWALEGARRHYRRDALRFLLSDECAQLEHAARHLANDPEAVDWERFPRHPQSKSTFVDELFCEDASGKFLLDWAFASGDRASALMMMALGAPVSESCVAHEQAQGMLEVYRHLQSSPHISLFSSRRVLQLPIGTLCAGVEGVRKACSRKHDSVVAFLMATHPRLGASSPVRALPRDVLGLVVDRFVCEG